MVKRATLLLVLILSMSSFIHLWNPVGFPDIFFDEGIYMRRAMTVIQEGNPQESYLYDHPYFGQMVLASGLVITGYPDSVDPKTDPDSISSLYLVPRLFMGLLAVLDTWLLYRIVEKKYGQNTALLAAAIFAVLPFSWVFRRILLDNILLPLLLGSILLAMNNSRYQMTAVTVSGILLGLAIFTKIPAFTFIPLIVFLLWKNKPHIKRIGLWFMPVILIPISWPIHSITNGEFDLWISDVLWQAGRSSGGLGYILVDYWNIDPVLLVIGIAGFVYAGYKRDYFVLLWLVPMLILLGTVGFTQYFHWNTLIPVFAIAGALILMKIVKQIQSRIPANAFYLVFASIVVFGMISTSILITTNVTDAQFEATSFVLEHTKNQNNITILASPTYSWIFDKIFERENVPLDYSHVLYYDIPTKDMLVVADSHLIYDFYRGSQIQQIYNDTKTIKQFEGHTKGLPKEPYPHGSFKFNYEGADIQIRTNYGNSS